MATTNPRPGLATLLALVVLVLCRGTTAAPVVPDNVVAGNINRNEDVDRVEIFPLMQYSLQLSWDAGILDGALHLTADDIYQPPVQHPPDGKEGSAGNAMLKDVTLQLFILSSNGSLLQEASFSTSFTMSFRSRSSSAADDGLLLEVLPPYNTDRVGGTNTRARYFSLANTTSSDDDLYVEMGKLQYYYYQWIWGLYVSVAPATATAMPLPARYTVWIDYDAAGHSISVYAAADGNPKPVQATLQAPFNITGLLPMSPQTTSYYGYLSYDPRVSYQFGLFASKNRTFPSCQPVVYGWNLTVDRLTPHSFTVPAPTSGRRRGRWLLPLVLSLAILVATGAAIAAALAAAPWVASWYRALVMKLKLSRALRRLPGTPREFKYADVKKATSNFHHSKRLGTGGFGAVYRGTLLIGGATGDEEAGGRRRRRRRRAVEVAVKKFTRKESRGYDDFLAEVAVINRLRHRNIVPLLGWCYENGELLLIYQYMPNGSLDQHLFRDNRDRPPLRWETRYNVVRDVAAGLHYVHNEYERVVLHRDIKASNVMLDAAFRGRLGDFGLARVVGLDKTSVSDLGGVAGTWGFIAPEYAVTHKATRQTDVYAFGVLVLEVVTGKRSLAAADAEFPLLADWVWRLHGEGRLLDAVDYELAPAAGEVDADHSTRLLEGVAGTEADAAEATRLLLLGLACSSPTPSDRPSMADVVQVIAKTMPPPDVPPVKPTFVWPPDGELDQLFDDSDDDDDDDLVGMSHNEPGRSHGEVHDGMSMSIGSLEITVRRFRSVPDLARNRA